MLKKSITYTDLNGDTVTEDHYFHLSKADLVEMEMSHQGGLAKWLERIVESQDGAAIITEFRNLILKSYGVKSDDGRRFIKTQEMRDEFQSSEAYSTLFLDLCTDAGAAAEFVNGIVPQGIDQDVAALGHPSDTAAQPAPTSPAERMGNVFEQQPPHVLTRKELVEMDEAELRSGLAEGRYKLS
jgi:hypothetical protein